MSFELTPSARGWRDKIRGFVDEELRPWEQEAEMNDGEIPAEEIAGRIILIGTSAAGLLDLRATPIEASVPGIELHAQAVEKILKGAFLQRPDFATPAELLYILLLGTLIAATGGSYAWAKVAVAILVIPPATFAYANFFAYRD